jgi:ATP-dependent Clp endopeptidase proteolytic subunit ClpP
MRNWYTMKAEEKSAEIVIYDEIGKSWWGEETVSAKQFLEDLNALGEVSSIKVRINSPGGDVFDGVAIHNALKNHKATITAQVDGLAASAASFIAMAADKIVMPSNSFMLIHGASGFVWGKASDVRALADDLDRIDQSLTATYVARAKSTTAKVKALMAEDRLMSADEAKKWGFTDEVIEPVKTAANFSLKLLPKACADRFRAETGTEQEEGDPASPASPEAPEKPPATPAPPAEPTKPADDPAKAPDPAAASAKVITLDAAMKQGIEEHQKYVTEVTDLCTLAQASERVGAYVRASTPIDQVRKELLELRLTATLVPHHPQLSPAQPPAKAWEKITDKLNARSKR